MSGLCDSSEFGRGDGQVFIVTLQFRVLSFISAELLLDGNVGADVEIITVWQNLFQVLSGKHQASCYRTLVWFELQG